MNAKFEKFCTEHRDKHGLCFFTVKKPDSSEYIDQGTNDALLGWNASLDSLEVTDELVTIYNVAVNESQGYPVGTVHPFSVDVLKRVLSALKEQAK